MMAIPTIVLIVSLLYIISFLLLYSQASKTLLGKIFLSLLAFTALWNISIPAMHSGNAFFETFSAYLFILAPIFLLESLLIFSLFVNRRHGMRVRIHHVAVALCGLVASSVLLFTIMFGRLVTIDNGIQSVDTVAYSLYSSVISMFFVMIFLILFKKMRAQNNMKESLWAKNTFIGALFSALVSSVTNIALPINGVYSYIFIGPLSTIFFIIISMFFIMQYGLFDIRKASIKLAVNVLILLSSIVMYILFYFIFVNGKGNINDNDLLLYHIWFIFVAFVVGVVIKPSIDSRVDKILNNKFNFEKLVRDFSRELAKTSNIDEIVAIGRRCVGQTLHASYTNFLLIDELAGYGDSLNEDIKTILKKVKKLTYYDDFTNNHLFSIKQNKILLEKNAAFLAPLKRNNTIYGYVIIGGARNGQYTHEHEKLIRSFINEITVAIQSAMAVNNLAQVNDMLQDRIERATHKLRISNQNLRALDKTKDEFMSMASHNLRTPLTSIKGFVSGVLEGDAGEINDMQRMMLEQAFNSSNRMVGLVGDLLNLSRIQSGKFILIPTTFSIVDILQEELTTLKQLAEAHKVTIHTNIDNTTPNITADQEKIRQVIMNLLDNAIYYSKKGEGEVTVSLTHTAHTVLFKVMDNGIGVPKDMQDKLFSKFHRAENAKKQRPDGTGIGLYMAKQVVDLHKGKIIFKSKEGLGSTFGFTIPKDGGLR